MDFRRKTRRRIEPTPASLSLEQLYPHNVMLYILPPTEDVTINEFEELALERLKVLRIIEQVDSRGLRFLSDEWKEQVNAELVREDLKGYLRLCTGHGGHSTAASSARREADLQARRRDYISHFLLRLVYCRTTEMKRWFLTHELELFKYKFSALSNADIKQFLEFNKLNYMPMTEEEKNMVKDGLYESTMGQSVAKIELLEFYKVPFTQVLDLVRWRRCYLKGGWAYINTHDFGSIVGSRLTGEMEHGLNEAQQFIRDIESDDRLYHLLKGLHTSNTGKEFTLNKDTPNVPIETLDDLSKKSYPLCMRACHEHLRENHHLKHGGRMQYGLFLKGIGVTLEDSLRFWRTEFTKKMDMERFSKSYEYNIQHNYGKRGSMVNYTPYSCFKIIDSSVVLGDVHGCPFKTYEQSHLKNKLLANGLSPAHAQEVMSFASNGHYQLACGKYFQITHNSPDDISITHPNLYFEQSQALMLNRSDKKGDRKLLKRSAALNTTSSKTETEEDTLWISAEELDKCAPMCEESQSSAMES